MALTKFLESLPILISGENMKGMIKKIQMEKTINKIDYLVMVILLLLSAVFFLLFQGEKSDRFVVYVENEIYTSGTLLKDDIIQVVSQNGEMEIVVENGEIFISNSTCQDKICLLQGKKSKSGSKIICLPNKTVVQIIGDIDEVTG